MASLSLLSLLPLLLLLSPLSLSARRLPLSLLSASSDPLPLLSHGSPCQLSPARDWTPPFCEAGPLSCLISSLPSSPSTPLSGTCDSNLPSENSPPSPSSPPTPFCTVGPFKFAVGAQHIPPYGPSSCETCSCVLSSSNATKCECDPLPACHVDRQTGQTLAPGCPYGIQTTCVITDTGMVGGETGNGQIGVSQISKGSIGVFSDSSDSKYMGRCQAPQEDSCVSAGPNWGPFFFAVGTKGVPEPGNKCSLCTCGERGKFENCQLSPDCRTDTVSI